MAPDLVDISHDRLDAIIEKTLVVGIDIMSVNKWELCNGCAPGKQTRSKFQLNTAERAKAVLEFVHSDVCGPMQTATFSNKRYFVTFIDDKSRFSVVFLLRSKSEMLDKLVLCIKFAEIQAGKHVEAIRSDNGGE
uniref:Integrase catalytic domain-containing protein n=1 Tax=Peronospora matthiolae TaxID=2874970 RepID=A0AAV1TC70_9STRA